MKDKKKTDRTESFEVAPDSTNPFEDSQEPESEISAEEIVEFKVKQIIEENESLKKQLEEYLDSLQRERANFANYKKRIEVENAQIYDRALGEHIKLFLPVVDDLERSLKNSPESGCDGWIAGIELILQKLLRTLESSGVKRLEVLPGDEFDPNTQEAVTHEEYEGYTDGQVIEVVQNGYKIKDRVIRPALVRVAK